ncbi:hypothetical protein CC78DRAFT_618493 [Lojkania enalia]|uniref:Uncharacterized protein n=1 Tax=Lojkania enalia TaxID=147567 RepID=A0A9P4K4G2_9PLEO|nr:hypothetical protein CC78DRAFT_618493 [Didymosphaeria enalia]
MTSELPGGHVEDDVYIGIWINRLYGPVHGATLTLDRQSGGLLIAFLALYVTVTGKSFWRIVRFWCHFFLSSIAHPDGVYHQRQAILRNWESAPDAAWEFIKIAVAWRRRARSNWTRLIPPLILAVFVTAGFAIAGLFSSHVTASEANEVLLYGKNCYSNTSAGELVTISNRYRKFAEDLVYAMQCYQDLTPGKCQAFAKTRLNYRIDRNATCPFENEMCRTEFGNVLLETGFLDSNEHFGINFEPRFQYRLRQHCAPLVTQGFSNISTDSQNPNNQFMQYFYGEPVGEPNSNDTFMFQVPATAAQNNVSLSRNLEQTIAYRLAVRSQLDFSPVPQLLVPNALTSVYFLEASGIRYLHRVEDPWFSATTPLQDPLSKSQYFVADDPAGVVGCSTQIYLCNPQLPPESRCVNKLTNISLSDLQGTWPDQKDRAAILGTQAAVTGLWTGQPALFAWMPGLPSLLASRTLLGQEQHSPLPSNMWQREAEYSLQATLASMQASGIETSRVGTAWPNQEVCYPKEACQKLCRNQKIRSPRFYSFSVLGLSLILCLGLFIMILAAYLENILDWVIKLRGQNQESIYARLEWQTNSTLHFQRLAHEALGLGTWTRTSDFIPVTEPVEKLGILDISDPKHTRLTDPMVRDEFKKESLYYHEKMSSSTISI